MWRKYDKQAAIYHTKSKIVHFQFAVSLKNISSLIKVPKFERASDVQSLLLDSDELIEDIQIGWQEKIFSAVEIEVYSDATNCANDIQKKYHSQIRAGENVRQGKIFTYVQEDNFRPKEELLRHTESKSSISCSALQSAGSEEDKDEVAMFIYASLGQDVLLFEVHWRPNDGVLIISPDFNESDDCPYFIEIDSDYRQLFSYTVKNVSKSMDISNYKRPRTKSIRPTIDVDRLFDMPPKLATKFLVLFEIKSAVEFEYENLHVRYSFSLPDRFTVEEGSSLVGSTHSSVSLNGVWKFGHCFHFAILSSTKVPIDESVKAYFEVVSIDSWTRERSEGFGQFALKLRPQQVQAEIQCFRIDYGFRERLERFFIGGRRRFDLEKFSCTDEDLLNRYHVKTISTGRLRIQCQMIVQNHRDMTKAAMSLDSQFKGLKLDDVLKRHHEARERLENVAK